MSNLEAFIGGALLAAVFLSIAFVSGEKIAEAQQDLRAKCNPVAEGNVAEYDGSLDDLCGENYSKFIHKPEGNKQ